MAQIDHSIYLQQQTPDLLGNVQRGLQMRDMLDKKAAQKQKLEQEQAYNKTLASSMDEQGNLKAGSMAALAGLDAGRALKDRQTFGNIQQNDIQTQRMGLQQKMDQVGAISQLFGSATDQNSWDQSLKQAQSMGLDVSDVSPQYDPNHQKMIVGKALTAQQRMAEQARQQNVEFDREKFGYQRERDQREFGLRQEELASNRDFRERQHAANQDYRNRSLEQRDQLAEYKTEQAKTQKEERLQVPGLGVAQTPEDAKKLKDSVEMKSKFDRQIGELIDLRKKYGVEYFNREAVGRGKQLSKDLLLTYKNLSKLGVLSKSDEDIINAIIPSDPLGHDFSAPGQDSILHQLTKFKSDLDDDYKTTIRTRLKNPEEAIAQIDQKSSISSKPQTVTQNGHTYTLNPQTGEYE